MKVNLAVPVAAPQSFQWWEPLWARCLKWQKMGIDIEPMVGRAAMPDVSKNVLMHSLDSMNGNNGHLTHENRNKLAGAHMETDAEWIFWVDHDTVPPADSLPKLLAMEKPFVNGIYFHRDDRNFGLIYRRTEEGMYSPIVNYEKGAVMQVDAVGLGCALVHRSVFDKIRENYLIMRRERGSVFIVHKDDVKRAKMPGFLRKETTVYDNGHEMWLVDSVHPLEAEFRDRPFPYFDMESGRTEDIGFCERAQRVGFEIWVDTSIECQHLGDVPHMGDRFRRDRDDALIAGVSMEGE